jgi:hypothetical protein
MPGLDGISAAELIRTRRPRGGRGLDLPAAGSDVHRRQDRERQPDESARARHSARAPIVTRWRRPPTHALVAARQVPRRTGLTAEEVLLQHDTQRLVRIDENGAREEFVRIPVELLVDEVATEGDHPRG